VIRTWRQRVPAGAHGCSGWRIWDGSTKTFHEQVGSSTRCQPPPPSPPPPNPRQPDVRLEVCSSAPSASASAAAAQPGNLAPIADLYRSLDVRLLLLGRRHHRDDHSHSILAPPPPARRPPCCCSLIATSTTSRGSYLRRRIQAAASSYTRFILMATLTPSPSPPPPSQAHRSHRCTPSTSKCRVISRARLSACLPSRFLTSLILFPVKKAERIKFQRAAAAAADSLRK
jgi:hypothetical protein